MPWTAADIEKLMKDTQGKWTAEAVENLVSDIRAGNTVNINDPINRLTPLERDRAEQARRAKLGTSQTVTPEPIINVVEEPAEQKPSFWQSVGGALKSIITDPLGSVVKGAAKVDEALASSDNMIARNIDAGLARTSQNILYSLPGGYDSQSGAALQIRENAERALPRGDDNIIGQVIQTIPQVAGTLYTSAATGGGKVLPFLYSLGQAYGGAYGQARDVGVSHEQARNAALIQAIPQAAIEVSGGIENLLGQQAGQGLLRSIGRAALEEALEEVAQYPFEGLSQKLTYAPETPVFSVNEQAIINPVQMAQNAAVGGLAGGLFGGAIRGANAVQNIRLPAQIEPEIKPSTPTNMNLSLPEMRTDIPPRPAPQTETVSQQTTVAAEAETTPTTTITPETTQQAQQQAAPTTEAPQQARIFSEEPTGTIPEGMRERGFSRNIRTDAAMNDTIRQSFDENPLTYDPLTNKETLQKAQEIFNKGQAEAEADFYKSIGKDSFRPEDIPLAKMLAQQAIEQGDIAKARQILSDAAERLTLAGRTAQAAKILRQADPESFLMTADKLIKRINDEGSQIYRKKWKDVELTPEEIQAIRNLPRGNEDAYERLWEQIGERIAKELPSSGIEKFNTWRRMAMLLNPKTHIRNIGGNIIMSGMRKAADTIGAALQSVFVPEGQRTQAVGWSFNKDIVAKVNENWDAVKKDLLGESRWEVGNLKSLNREKRIFNKGQVTQIAETVLGRQFDRGFLQWLNDLSLKTLNLEDNIFTERAYKDALGQYLQANNLTEVTSEAVEYAKRRALEATFKQFNELAATIDRWKQKPIVGFFVEGAMPFTKTPANIVMRGIEYSPGGLFKALYDAKAGKGAAVIIEDLSKGLTGSVIMAIGFWLASMGWAKVAKNRSPKVEALYQELGDQRYAINTPLGSYTFDWAQPFSIPFAMGVAAQEALRDRKDGDTIIQAVIDGLAAGGDTIFNMTMLQNVREILGSYGSPTEKIMGIPIDYLEQAIFSVFGQTARTIDPIRRSTYDPNPIQQWLNSIQARLPGLSQNLQPALNIWGEEQMQGGAFQQFINPGYYRARSNDPVTNELVRLYEAEQDTDILPKVAPKSFTDKGKEYRLSAEQVTEFQRIMGQENRQDIARLISSAEYQRLTDEQRIKRIKKIVDSNYETTKKAIINAIKATR